MDIWGSIIWNVGLWCKEWIPVLAPTGVFFVALVAYRAYRQRLLADKRDQWWTRAQWAIDTALDTNVDVKLTGLTVLTSLKADSLATPEDVALFDSISGGIQTEIVDGAVAISAPGPDNGTGGSAAATAGGADTPPRVGENGHETTSPTDTSLNSPVVQQPRDRRKVGNDKPGNGQGVRGAGQPSPSGPFSVRLSALGERTVTVETLPEKRLLEQAEKLLQAEPAKTAKRRARDTTR